MKKEVTFEIMKKKTKEVHAEAMQHYDGLRKIMGHSVLSEEGRNKLDALTELERYLDFSEDMDDYLEWLKKSDESQEVKRYMKRYLRRNFSIEVQWG